MNLFLIVLIHYYKLHKINLNRGGPCIVFPKWLKNKKVTINPKSNDDKFFQYALTVAQNYQNIENNPERISKIRPFVINIVGKKQIFHHKKKSGKSLNQIINQLLLIFYMCLTIVKK